MISTIKSYLIAGGVAIGAICLTIFSFTRKENKLLKQINKDQEESLKIVDTKEKVATTVHKGHKIQEASIEKSIQETKDLVNETNTPDTPLDPEFIRLLNKNRNKV